MPDLEIGQEIDRYRITHRLGETSYLALDLSLQRTVVVRFPPDIPYDEQAIQRFTLGVRAAMALNHPNILTIYDLVRTERTVFVVVQFVEGQTLREVMNAGPLNTDLVLRFGNMIASGLAEQQERGLLNLEVDPATILVTRTGIIKLSPLGPAYHALWFPGTPEATQSTSLGTLAYSSPEKITNRPDQRSDVFSFGALLYEMATARKPFEGETPFEVYRSQSTSDPVAPTTLNPSLPGYLEAVIMRALQRDPDQRFQSVLQMRAGLAVGSLDKFVRSVGRTRPGVKTEDLEDPILRPTAPAEPASRGQDPEFKVVRVFYASDRRQSGNPEPKNFFDDERADERKISFGVCEVSIPESEYHKIGMLEKPSIFKLQFKEDPKKHVVLVNVEVQRKDQFLTKLRQRVGKSARREAFLFIHGYNVRFEDAARRTAQLASDLQFDGAPVFYSWPSRGKWWQYTADEASVEWAIPQLETVLRTVALECGADIVHLIAHSMGNRVLTAALQLLVARRDISAGQFRHIVLTAPDIDRDTFDQLAAAIKTAAGTLTMYSNPKDRALLLSKLFHFYRRAGSSIIVMPGMDMIDASRVDTSLNRHSYFGSNRTVLADLQALLVDGRPPGKRFGMLERRVEAGSYYIFVP